MNYIAEGKEPPSWTISKRLISEGFAGALIPSFAPGASDKANLVLWKWGNDLPHRVAVFDPYGQLPKNQSSWS